MNNNILTENDANCFCLSEAFDGSASRYKTVFGIILGSGCGGGLVINKRIISGANGLGGEWSLNQMPIKNVENLKINKVLDFSNRIEGYLSGKSIEKRFYENYKNNISAKKIFALYRNSDKNSKSFINEYKEYLSRSLVLIITTIDPDAIVFGGGVSANSYLKKRLYEESKENGWEVFIPDIQYTTDNAAMIGIVGYLKYINSDISDLKSTPLPKYNF